MSLISEALKRARLEAAHQEAAREGRPYAPPLHIPERRRSWPLLAAGLAVGALLVGGVGAGLYLGSRSHGPTAPQPAPAGAAATTTPRESVASTAQPTQSVEIAAPSIPRPISREIASPMGPLASTPPTTTRPDPAAPRSAAPPSGPSPVETRAATVPEPSRPAAPPARRERPATAPVPPTTIAASAAGDTGPSYHREAALPGGAKLQLSGIAYSDTQPVALINGKVVGPGEVIEGYTVVAIEAKRVEMQGRGGTLYLLLR